MRRTALAIAILLPACGGPPSDPAEVAVAPHQPAPNVDRGVVDTTTTTAAPPAATSTSRPATSKNRKAPPKASRSAGPGRSLSQIKQCESGGDYTTDTGNGYYGAYQFDRRTWESVGGSGNPAHASPEEQDRRAAELQRRRGNQPWPSCGR